MTKVLFVISAADRWTLNDGEVHPSGYWAEEVAMPYKIFSDAGFEITIATPGGKKPILDPLSLSLAGGSAPWKVGKIRKELENIQDRLDHPKALADVNPADFDLIFYPGGHGPMEDLAYDETSGRLLADRLASGRPLALLCHAPAAILAAADDSGRSPFAGRRMTGLSNREENFNSFAKKAPWLLEDKLKELGVEYSKARLPLRPYIVVDGNLYTGQNPQSSEMLAKRLVEDLSS